jgi:hypothetical protein
MSPCVEGVGSVRLVAKEVCIWRKRQKCDFALIGRVATGVHGTLRSHLPDAVSGHGLDPSVIVAAPRDLAESLDYHAEGVVNAEVDSFVRVISNSGKIDDRLAVTPWIESHDGSRVGCVPQ